METPAGVFFTAVDDRVRLRLPLRFQEWMANQKVWFLSFDRDGKSLQLRTAGDNDEAVEIDPDGRILIPPEFSTDFKSKEARVFWRKDRLVLMTVQEFKSAMQTITPVPPKS